LTSLLSRRDRLRSSFNESAELYDEVRPGYPTSIIDTIIADAELPPDGKILEIGCGTGQITIPFASRGYRIVALELGAALAALAIEKCRQYPRVDIVSTSFEAWQVQEQAFDLVVSAQAFHWIDPTYGFNKAAAALKCGGASALVWNLDVTGQTAFNQASRAIYETYLPVSASGDINIPVEETALRYTEALKQSDRFTDVREFRHGWDGRYSGAHYLKLLHTYSNHSTLPEPEKTRFFQAIAEAIDRTGGTVQRNYETLLLMARPT
jgi:SAM-dependent methyltransferase